MRGFRGFLGVLGVFWGVLGVLGGFKGFFRGLGVCPSSPASHPRVGTSCVGGGSYSDVFLADPIEAFGRGTRRCLALRFCSCHSKP